MKRLVAVAFGTDNFQYKVDTNQELDLIQKENNKLTRNKLINYENDERKIIRELDDNGNETEINNNLGSFGGFYIHKGQDEKVRIYIVDCFGFKGIKDNTQKTEHDALAYVATKINSFTGEIEPYQYVKIFEPAKLIDREKNMIQFNNMQLEYLGKNFQDINELLNVLGEKIDLTNKEKALQ